MLVSIVEGQSEAGSVGVLLRRMLHAEQIYDLDVARPFRVKRARVVREGELEKSLTQAIRSRDGARAVLVILDSNDECPRDLGPALLDRAQAATELPIAVVLAKREFEAWFLGAKESLRGVRGIRADAVAPDEPEVIRDAKGRLSDNMEGDRGYIPVDDQPALATEMDLETARTNCASFAKLTRDLGRLIATLK